MECAIAHICGLGRPGTRAFGESICFSARAQVQPFPPSFALRCAGCAAARAALAKAASALGPHLATPLTYDLTQADATAAFTGLNAGLKPADAAPGVVAWLTGAPPSDRLAPDDATPAAIASLALDHARTVAAGRLGVESLDGMKGERAPPSSNGGGSCGCGKDRKAAAEKDDEPAATNSKKKASSTSSSSDLPRATAFFGRSTHVRALNAASLRTLTRSPTPALITFYAPWCGHCQSVKPELSAAAEALARAGSPAVIGAVDCTQDQAACDGAGVRGFPTIKWIDEGGKSEDYGGPRAADAFEAFVAGRAKAPPPEVRQLVDAAGLELACLAPETRLCLLAFLPHIADTTAAGRRAALAQVTEVAGLYAGRPYGWAWAAAGDHPALEAAVGLGYGWPAFVAVVPPSASGAPANVAHLKGAFNRDGLRSFIEGARTGRVGAAGVEGELRADGQVEAWDGADAAAVGGGDDEFSLADLGLA